MIRNMLMKVQNMVRKFLKDRKGESHLLSVIGMIAIVVGILVVVSPTIRTSTANMVTNALNTASGFFSNAVQGK
ncbi:MAG: hypothetical protein PWP75_971 [Caldanaerobacter sp.]|nr:hypothetical protein [Caldanaerobacter sp.]